MRIGELAGLAGVSVRQVRHYHRLGLLAEPPRTPGGYRVYEVADLVRALHIRSLAESGVPLRSVSTLLDRSGGDMAAEIDLVRRDLDAQIERLERRRAQLDVIAERVASGRGISPLPPAVARTYSDLLEAASGQPELERLLRAERDAFELLALSADFPPELVASVEAIGADPVRREAYLAFLRDFASIEGRPVSAVSDVIDRIARKLARDEVLRGLIVQADMDSGDGPQLEQLVADPAQQEVVRRLFALLGKGRP